MTGRLDRDAAREVIARVGKVHAGSVSDALLDALEGCVRPAPAQTVDRDALIALFYQWDDFPRPGEVSALVDAVLALLRPADGVTLTPDEAHLVADFVREHVDTGWADPEWPTDDYLRALADRLEAAGGR